MRASDSRAQITRTRSRVHARWSAYIAHATRSGEPMAVMRRHEEFRFALRLCKRSASRSRIAVNDHAIAQAGDIDSRVSEDTREQLEGRCTSGRRGVKAYVQANATAQHRARETHAPSARSKECKRVREGDVMTIHSVLRRAHAPHGSTRSCIGPTCFA